MEAVIETTGGEFPAHTYLLDGTVCVAYIRSGTSTPYYFANNGIKGFDKRGRKFEKASLNLFPDSGTSNLIEVTGSKGQSYFVDTNSGKCSCPGFQFRGECKHLKVALQQGH